MKMDSKYWIQRALQQEQNAQIVSDRYMANVGRQLASYRQDLISEIETFYARYAKDHKMSHAEAKRYLRDNEMKEFQGVTLEKFRAMALNPDTPTPLLDALAYRHRISRKEALLAEIERKTAELYGGKDGIADNVVNNMSEVYVKGKIQQMKNLADFGIVEKPILNLKAVQNKLATNWSGQEFSERIWGQSQRTFNSIQKVIDQGLTGGWSVDRMSKELILRTGVAYSQAETLVRTETTFYNNLATLDTIKDLGGEYYEIVAVLDTRTSDICRHENKKIYPISEYKAGQTAPPFHVRCRSTIMPSHQSKDGEKSDNPYVDILANDHKVNVAPSDKSLNDVFDEWEHEGDRLLGKVGYPQKNSRSNQKEMDEIDFYNNISTGLNLKEKTLINFDEYAKEWYNKEVKSKLEFEDIQAISEKLKTVLDNSNYAMRFRLKDIDSLIESERFMNQFETGTSGGTIHEGYRKQATNNLFGVKSKITRKKHYEKYGYFGNKDPMQDYLYNKSFSRGVSQYGDVIVHFSKEKMDGKVTFTINNSLGPSVNKEMIADNPNSPHLLSVNRVDFDYYISSLKSKKFNTPEEFSSMLDVRYIEAQYHGDVVLSDVSSMHFTDEKPNDNQVKALKKYGIKLFVREGDRFVEIE
nr:MAG TPA: minor capsid protein [Caudoviricetes sp.]